MSKKRPRAGPPPAKLRSLTTSKQDPRHWWNRLFKSRYTYKGKRIQVRSWAVKIQHLGTRKTFALRSSRRSQAAVEACNIYRALVAWGWKTALSRAWEPGDHDITPSGDSLADSSKFNAAYSARRFIHRGYTMSLQAEDGGELSVRIDHLGTGHYFPLATNNRRLATRRTLRIHQDIVSHGWEWVKMRYSREVTIGFRWLDGPLVWTYTTIHTQCPGFHPGVNEPASVSGGGFPVSVTESDQGIRRALEWCVNHMADFHCVATYASAAEALRGSSRQPARLALINQNLVDASGFACLAQMRQISEVAGLLYSVCDDSEELFRTTPGGAITYLLKRTLPTQFLEPITARLQANRLLGDDLVSAAWQYFKESLAPMPAGAAARPLANLTPREHEVLGLIGKGHPDKDIAVQLKISVHTVHEHVRNIFEKLGAHNRTEAAMKLLQK